jgi:4-alpha-glucanotransferase
MTQPKFSSLPMRGAGILLHPTSLPGGYGIGDLGAAAYGWVDALVRARQQWWQILPLGPTGYGDSPYQCFSAFAGNPYLVSPDELVKDGLLSRPDLENAAFPADRVDYGPVIQFKIRLLGEAWKNHQAGKAPALKPEFETFCQAEASWLDDFAFFMALKDAHGGASWLSWETDLVRRAPAALARAGKKLADALAEHKFRQFLFFRQWRALKAYANAQGVKLIGDIPIFVSSDSADVWGYPEGFLLDKHRRPTVVAGVPPDYFSATGQLWGNPLYNWEALRATQYAWWMARLGATLKQVDLVRVDHFRGFEAYWEVQAGQPTAEVGRWVKGPGADLFEKIGAGLGSQLPIIAEDLGIITPEVDALREQLGFPGMRILQFAFTGDPHDRYLPHMYERNTVVYTGTHDNDTTLGWYRTAPENERDSVRRYAARDGHDVAWDFIRLAWSSVADLAVAPLQDVLSLGSEARMNTPGRADGNWGWRYQAWQLQGGALERLAEMTALYGRTPKKTAGR